MRKRSRFSIMLIALPLIVLAMTSCLEPLTTAEVQQMGTNIAAVATRWAPTLRATVVQDKYELVPQDMYGTVAPDMGGLKGLVTDSIEGTRIVGAQIVFEREDGAIREETTSRSNGGYSIALPPGRYRVSAFHNDYQPFQSEGFYGVPDTKYHTGNIMMVPKADITRIPKVKPTIAPPPTTADCGGAVFAGICWHHGAENLSCAEVCAPYGGYHDATRTYAGSDGSSANCKDVLNALNIPLDDFYESPYRGMGCYTIQLASGNYGGYWDQDPTTASATISTPGRRRICACYR